MANKLTGLHNPTRVLTRCSSFQQLRLEILRYCGTLFARLGCTRVLRVLRNFAVYYEELVLNYMDLHAQHALIHSGMQSKDSSPCLTQDKVGSLFLPQADTMYIQFLKHIPRNSTIPLTFLSCPN